MAIQVVWNKKATHNFDEIVHYLMNEVSENTASKFVINVDKLLRKLYKYPEIGRKSLKQKSIRQYRIDKYRKLYYRISGSKLIIVFIFDERRNPKLNPY